MSVPRIEHNDVKMLSSRWSTVAFLPSFEGRVESIWRTEKRHVTCELKVGPIIDANPTAKQRFGAATSSRGLLDVREQVSRCVELDPGSEDRRFSARFSGQPGLEDLGFGLRAETF